MELFVCIPCYFICHMSMIQILKNIFFSIPSIEVFYIWNTYFRLQNKFAAFCQYAKTFNSDEFDYEELKSADHVFMRWKEHFLVPDHTIRDISGASFAGFYYICFQKSTSSIEGYYYHRSSEW